MNTMIFKTVAISAGKLAVKTGMKLRKASPEIMLVGGIACGVAAVVTACIATKKVAEEKVVEETHEELNDISPDDKKANFKAYGRFVRKMIRIYGPTILLVLLSVGLVLGSHGILKKRYVSTTIAYKALDEAFKDYRKRVQDAVGEDKELHFYNGTEECGERTVIDENGEAHTEKDIQQVHKKKNSPYEFDWNSKTAPGNWESNTDYNIMFLQSIQNYANDLLHSRGHVFLNEVLDAIGIKRTREGSVVGWMLGLGDDFVDFGIADYYTDEFCDIQAGKVKNIHLNMNCDGLIWDKI